jgi:hypothetical protein
VRPHSISGIASGMNLNLIRLTSLGSTRHCRDIQTVDMTYHLLGS